MARNFSENGMRVIHILTDELTVEEYDLYKCYGIFGRFLNAEMTFEEIKDRFEDLWESGEVVTLHKFKIKA